MASSHPGRGDGYAPSNKRMNFILLWGCRPSRIVAADTKMAEEVSSAMAKFDKSNLCLKFPDAFEFLQGKDAKYEMVATNLL